MTQRDRWKKRPAVVRYRAWADTLRAAARQVPAAEQVLSLSWVATFEPPTSWSKKRRLEAIGTLHRAKPDASNILKGIEDILWPANDSALAAGQYEKRWGWQASLEIRIEVV
jgi:Holliday junction resolvase RusA-like endonuclease